MDALEKEHLRRKMADRMVAFVEASPSVSCVSGHFYDEPQGCDLCLQVHAQELLVIKNRKNKKMKVAASCLREMVRFKVTDVEDFARWLAKISELEKENERREAEKEVQGQEDRKLLEKKFIVRRRTETNA